MKLLKINWNKLETIGIFGVYIFGIIMLIMILTGNTYTLIPFNNPLVPHLKAIPIWNDYFDYSILGMFSCLLIFSGSKI